MSRSCSKDVRRLAYSFAFTGFVALSLIVTYPRGLDHPRASRKTSTRSAVALQSSFDLARRESLGLFQDIPSDEWVLQREHARAIANGPIYNRRSGGAAATSVVPMITCPHAQQIGNATEKVLVCEAKQLYMRADCLIYSIRSAQDGQDRGFERDLYAAYGRNCEIHVFDPHSQPDQEAEKRHIYHHAWEIWGTAPMTNGITPVSLFQAMEQLGHTKRRIDILHIAGVYALRPDEQLPKTLDVRQLLLTADVTLDTSYLGKMMDWGLVPFATASSQISGDLDSGWGFVRVHSSFLEGRNENTAR